MKNVLLSGGTGGIGTAIGLKFIEAGYHVIASHNNKSDEFLNNWKIVHGINVDQITFINCNLTKYSETAKVIDTLLELTEIDVLINNAGITNDSSFLKMNYDQWFDVLDTNLIGIFGFTQAVARQMVSRQIGNIVNISSINGLKGQFGQTNYSASKAGIIGFTKSLALELAGKGVRVNAICPGYTKTPMVAKLPAATLEKITSHIPTQDLVSPCEIANTALYIVQDMPSLTGETISVNGGHYMH